MKNRTPALSIALGLVLFAAAPLFAQVTRPTPPRPPAPLSPRAPAPPPAGIQFRAYFLADTTSIGAKDTFEAVFGKTNIATRGAGGEVLNLWKGTFARVSVASGSLSGERVVVVNGDAIPLGIPLTVKMQPLELAAGWRFRQRAPERFTPYVGVGLVRVGYEETSEFARPGEDVKTSMKGASIFAGVDVRIWEIVIAGVEGQYRKIDGLGTGGVSEAFDETELGGLTFRFLIGIRR